MILVGSTQSRAIDRPDGSFLDYSVDDRFLYINIIESMTPGHGSAMIEEALKLNPGKILTNGTPFSNEGECFICVYITRRPLQRAVFFFSDGVEYFHLNEAKPTPPRHRIPQYNTGK